MLAVGTIEPRKNLPRLVAAFEKLALDKDIQLVIAGVKGWLSSETFNAISNSRVPKQIVVTDYTTEEELRDLYSSCGVFVYPSLYEGFGLPPIEAMACGAPVIVSNVPALVESTGGAARIVAVNDENQLANVILEVLSDEDERRRLSSAGLKLAAELTWENTARETLKVYESVLDG